MSEPAPQFRAKGVMSMKDACLITFRSLDTGMWVSTDDLVAQVCELTEYPHEAASVVRAAHEASDIMALQREGGVGVHMGGYKRLDALGKVAAVDASVRRVRNGMARLEYRVGDAESDPEVSAADRQWLQEIHRTEIMRRELEARRAQRRQSMPRAHPHNLGEDLPEEQ